MYKVDKIDAYLKLNHMEIHKLQEKAHEISKINCSVCTSELLATKIAATFWKLISSN